LQVGPVVRPAGRRVTPLEDDAPVAWVTRSAVPEPRLVWSALTDLHDQTGLVPVVLQDDEDDIEDVFFEPCDVGQVDRLDPAELLAAHWEGEFDDDGQQAPGHRETLRVTEFLGLKAPGEGPDSLAGIAVAIARTVPDASAGLSRRSELDRQDAAPARPPQRAGLDLLVGLSHSQTRLLSS
jgi:hypothetical protein